MSYDVAYRAKLSYQRVSFWFVPQLKNVVKANHLGVNINVIVMTM